jgi:hypothetical protein
MSSRTTGQRREVAGEADEINKWYCEQLAYLARRLDETPEPGGEGSLLDNTLIVWTNELGKGNSHTLNNIPFVLVGNGLDFRMGAFDQVPRRWPTTGSLLSLAHGMGHADRPHRQPGLLRRGAALAS